MKAHHPCMRSLLATCALALTLTACAARPPHPNQANAFDGAAYDTLIVTDSVIKSTRTDLANNAFPAEIAIRIKPILNDLIASYNAADKVYQTYHLAALAGTATPAQSNAVTMALNDVQAKTAALTAAKAKP